MELELEPRHKILPFKVRAASKESQPHKAAHVLDADLRNHWSTSTNSKEWLLLELEETCLLHQIRIHNKSVLEWEISVGLRHKQPDTFLKVRPRCEAPRREFQYMTNYVPCRYVRISCLRGNPIAIFFVQLVGITVAGLEPEFQPLVDHLLPHIISHKPDTQDLYLQLLRDITTRLMPFLPHLEVELAAEGMESNLKFLAMLSGPFYPILMVVDGRERMKTASSLTDFENSKVSQTSVFTVSSNFQAPPRRSRSPVPSQQSFGHLLAFRPDMALLLLKVAYKDSTLGTVCRMIARLLRKLTASVSSMELNGLGAEAPSGAVGHIIPGTDDIVAKFETTSLASQQADYSSIFGDDFQVSDDDGGDLGASAFVDIATVEEGLLHFLYASASQPALCRRLADMRPDMLPVVPFIQAMLPALRPASNGSCDQLDESFAPWQTQLIQRAFSQIVSLSTSPSYRPLLDACAGYLSSFSLAHEKAACIIIDLCCGALAPWLSVVIAKVDLVFELVEELLGIIQGVHRGGGRARAALIYVMLGLSGHMDDIITMYKDAKHSILFLIEMLEPFLIPAATPVKNTIAFGDVSAVLTEKQEHTCSLALDFLRAAIGKTSVLHALESEWRQGHVMPSILLSTLAPHVTLPPGIDLRKGVLENLSENTSLAVKQAAVDNVVMKTSYSLPKVPIIEDERPDAQLGDALEDPNLLFAPLELKAIKWQSFSNFQDSQGFGQFGLKGESKNGKDTMENTTFETLLLDTSNAELFFNLQAEYLQLVSYQERELKASEFIRFAMDLHSQGDGNVECRNTAIDALLLAAECHLNPFFMLHATEHQLLLDRVKKGIENSGTSEVQNNLKQAERKETGAADLVSYLEEERDKAVLKILLKAAEWDAHGVSSVSEESQSSDMKDGFGRIISCGEDVTIQDATTLARRHQDLLLKFLVVQLQRERNNVYEALLQGLLFLLYAATQLSLTPDHIVDIILKSAEWLNTYLVSYHKQLKEGHTNLAAAAVHRLRRQWALLGRLVIAASGGGSLEDDGDIDFSGLVYYKDLVPASAWMARIAAFSSSPFPLVRYVGWKGLARFAKSQLQTGILLASDMGQLSSLLAIFADELTSSAILAAKKTGGLMDLKAVQKFSSENIQGQRLGSDQSDHSDPGDVANVLYPELELVSPNLRNQYSVFAQAMLDTVCLQLRSIPASAVPHILSWFSELCYCPFSTLSVERKLTPPGVSTDIKGFAVANVKFVILRLLEVILGEHVETIVPELPRVLTVVLSLCQSCYCDVSFLDTVLVTLKPIISYAVASESQVEDDPSALNFESLCFDSLMELLRTGPDTKNEATGQGSQGALLLFLSGFILSDLSGVRRNELMHLLMGWVGFTSYSPTTAYHNYLSAFQKILEACNFLVQKALDERGLSIEKGVPSSKDVGEEEVNESGEMSFLPLANSDPRTDPLDSSSQGLEELQDEEIFLGVQHSSPEAKILMLPMDEASSSIEDNDILARQEKLLLFPKLSELEQFEKCLHELVITLGSSLEKVWRLHSHLTEKLIKTGAHCVMITNFLSKSCGMVAVSMQQNEELYEVNSISAKGRRRVAVSHESALETVAQTVMAFQHSHCWQAAACTMDFLLSLPTSLIMCDNLSSVSLALQFQCTQAPRVLWRQWAIQWLSRILTQIVPQHPRFSSAPLTELFRILLEHQEPEQRAGALQLLEKLAELEDATGSSQLIHYSFEKDQRGFQCRGKLPNIQFIEGIVSATWDNVASLAACDPSLRIRRQAIGLLLRFVPLAQPQHLQRLLSSVDAILPSLAMSAYTMRDAPLTRMSLALFSRACLYSSMMDINMIPISVWSSLEILSKPKPGSIFAEAERDVCIALLQLREHGEDAKKFIQEALLRQTESCHTTQQFSCIRETVLEVLARLNTVRMMEDGSTLAALQEAKELEETEIEMELVKQEQAAREKFGIEGRQTRLASCPLISSSVFPQKSTKQRIEELRAEILAEERSATRAEIVARRERERLARRARQLALEETTLREIELLQELDREKAIETEREIERQRTLERERAKTRELRHSLDMEAEKRTQRDLQRELEQRESGVIRSSRREFSGSTSSSRPRERYRERESGRSSQESRPNSSSGINHESSTTPPATPTAGASTSSFPSIVIASSTLNSRAYPGQSLISSQIRDRMDDRGYDEGLDGVGINVEAGNYGDLEVGVIDMGSGIHRQGSRASRPRQIVERRERESRREGKWERKQT